MIDNNCHPFALRGGPLRLSSMSLDVRDDPEGDSRRQDLGAWRVIQELLTSRLSARLDCSPDDLIDARAEACRDWPRYTRELFVDAGISQLVMDASYPPGAEDAVPEYARLSGCRVHPTLRFEAVIDPLIAAGAKLDEVIAELERRMVGAPAEGIVSFKSIIAYRTGLDVDPDVTAREASDSLRPHGPVRRRGKALRDFVLRRALGLAADLRMAVHIHTGFGDSDLRLAESDPLLLEALLATVEGSAASVVLIHGAYPWHEEAAYLATTRPNVWVDASMINIFSSVTFGQRLLRMLDLMPAARLLLGTDGHHEPELFWFGAHVLHEGWRSTRSLMLDAGSSLDWVNDVEHIIFSGNAANLYGLEDV